MIRRNNNKELIQYRKKLFQIAKQHKWMPYIYMINNIIIKRCNNRPFNNPPGYNGKDSLYGIDYNIVLYSQADNEKQFMTWLEDWVNMIERKKITYYDSVTKDI